jgi:hypothetical protein
MNQLHLVGVFDLVIEGLDEAVIPATIGKDYLLGGGINQGTEDNATAIKSVERTDINLI